ncbi:MAG: hypothetical protein ABL993_00485, partial [Vicinamibacterales bacterium]
MRSLNHGREGVACALAVIASVLFTTACATRVPARTTPAPAPVFRTPPPPTQTPQVVTDPVADLIAASNRHFEAGSRELQLGHLETARNEFN